MKKKKLLNSYKRWWLYTDDGKLTKSWFSFLEWIFLTGALSYLKEKVDNQWVELFHIISVSSLYLFIHSRIGNHMNLLLDVEEMFVKNKKIRALFNVLSVASSLFILYWINKMVTEVITELQSQPL